MRNHSFAQPAFPLAMLQYVALGSMLTFATPVLHAQCSSDDNQDSFGCQLQQAAPLPSTAPSAASSAVLSLAQQADHGSPQADHATEASAVGSLPSGSSYTERASGNGVREDSTNLSQSLPHEPLSEFQRFVAATTGKTLPIYGANLFFAHPAKFGAIDQTPAPLGLVVGSGDELRIRIWGQINFSANLRVSREGEIYLPKAGAVHVAGLRFGDVASHLRNALDRIYRNFDLSVDMGEIHSIQIYVAGQASRPGEYTVSALNTMIDAAFLSGGPSASGSMRHVQLKRDGKVVTDLDLYALLVKGDKSGDTQLQTGDVLYIPPVGPEVALLGSVRTAAIYELRGDESIAALLDAAGGRTATASGGLISIERIVDHAQRSAFEVKADEAGLAAPLADGDIVRIDPIISSYRETVTLRGSVANPGRFLWHAGMHLSELIPDRESLVTRDYWWRRAQLGLPTPQLAQTAMQGDKTPKPAAVASPGAQTDWNYAVVERMDASTMATSLLPFNLGRLVLDHDMSQDMEIKPGDVVTIFSQQDIHPPLDEQTKYVLLEGEFVHPGIYSAAPGETLRSLAARAGGLTNRAYLYGSDFTRKSTQAIEQQQVNQYVDQLEHQLERNSVAMSGAMGGAGPQVLAINHDLIARLRRMGATGRVVLNLKPTSKGADQLPEMALEDGDRLLVPPTPSTVQAAGAVFNPSAFLYHKGSNVGSLLHLAGGPNRDADRGRAFVLRADGTVASHQAGGRLFGSGFENLSLNPGDTVVVPEKSIHSSPMSVFLAWAQMVQNFSLGAAAVNVIK